MQLKLAPAGFVWMHPPRDLTPELVPESDVTLRQALRWLHADAPPADPVPAPLCEPRPVVAPKRQVFPVPALWRPQADPLANDGDAAAPEYPDGAFSVWPAETPEEAAVIENYTL